jgi:hypothetical protein
MSNCRRTWETNGGVIFTAYEIRTGHWAAARRAPGQPEEILKIVPSPEYVEAMYRREAKMQQDLFRPWAAPSGFDCLQYAGDGLPGQKELFDA